MPDAVRHGAVAWTGDNPFIYLKTDPDNEWSSLSLFFRIAASRFGPGRLSLVIEQPYEEGTTATIRLALTDNEKLARFLINDFVAKFVLFRPSTALEDVKMVAEAVFSQHLAGSDWTETADAISDGVQHTIELRWEGLGEAFAVDVPAPESGTGLHEMFAVFRIADGASVTVDGARLPGTTVERPFLNGAGQSAGMAISETWVEQ
ncbi:hypothetical protein [Paenarthrobacter sp. PH39-S1]|uniref:hypothetical protein n=1 Tax=Paenarthrobacter sp. PH39-S1 TaxID=3046204 RepID=UPI0024BB0AF2|nr:hypothetical protein [Paenarthrobacter sp. PH39-S1]MDJ0358437.1 hypothetical protein [Paenarthrobacter sp. PH39-S1]